ncbi:MAG TPA: ATP-binding protein [Solirubrobacteraceae bacterium]
MTETRHMLASVDLHFEDGVVLARQRAREVASLLSFDHGSQTRIATAVSELARNAHRYAGGGRVTFGIEDGSLSIEVVDHGAGIADIEAVLSGHYQSSTGMGQGLIGVRRLMDSFEIVTGAGGTVARTAKRLPTGIDPSEADVRQLRADLARQSSRSAYDEVQEQNQELLQALGELRSRQDELLHLNLELDDTNSGVVALYAELDERAEQLRDADGKKSRFLADMSHELRTPLNSIIALADLLSGGVDPLSSEQRTQVEFIRRMAQDQLQLVGELLDLAKIEAGRVDLDLRPLSVHELFAALRIQLRPLVAGSDVALRFSCEPGLPPLVTDERKLIQILRNLVSNAVKYTTDGEVLVSASAVEGRLELAIDDTGVGIAEADLERIFDEFVQVAGEHQLKAPGTGLGLPLTRKLAEVLGGGVTAHSRLGQGSRFVVVLPWTPPAPGADAPVPPSSATPVSHPTVDLVLVADDDPAARYVVRRQLEGAVREIVEADCGAAALEFLSSRQPTALVLDLSMPDLDGLEVLERVRSIAGLERLAVVVHTSKELEPHEQARIERDHAVVIQKGDASSTGLLAALLEAARVGVDA